LKIKYLVLLSFFVIIFILIIVKGFDNRLRITKYEFRSKKINEMIKVAFLSDLHGYEYGKNQSDLIFMLEKMSPDIIVLVGDIIDDKRPSETTFLMLEKLVKIAPCFYVTGNHEAYTFQLDKIKSRIEKAGIFVLAGNREQIEVNNNKINILGIEDPFCQEDLYKKQVNNLVQLNNSDFTILLAHRPDRYTDYQKIETDLILSGHAHGGQFRIPKTNIAFYAPHQGLLPKLTKGFHQLEDSVLLVSRGMCPTTRHIPRFFNPPELIELTISSNK